jgi:hypothetical protein
MRQIIAIAMGILVSLSASAVERPFILWTQEEATAIRKRIETEDWARKQYEELCASRDRGGAFRNLFRYSVMGDRKAGEAEKGYLLGIIGTHPRTFEKLEHGGRHYDCYLDVLRYDSLYDLLSAEERGKIESTFREYIAYQLQDGKKYTRESWLPNMQWPRPMSAFIMAMGLQDKDLIEQTWNSRCGLKWYLDSYVADKGFYMEEFAKHYSMIGEMLLYCRGLSRLGLDSMGYGYTGKGGATVRGYVESILWVGYPRVDLGTSRFHYPKITMGDARGGGFDKGPPYAFQHSIVRGVLPNGDGGNAYWGGANMNGRDHRNTKVDKLELPQWFEIGHALWPDAGFDYFLAQLRSPNQDRYYPTLFWGLSPIDPATVKGPPAPSDVTSERGFAFLRSEESPAYWESPAPAVALQLGLYYVHYTHDCLSLLGYVAFNRPIYLNRGISDGYAGGDPWTDSGRGQCGVVVDGLQPQPVGQLPVRSGFGPVFKFVAVTDDPAASGGRIRDVNNEEIAHTRTVYEGTRTQRALFLTREYLFDVVRLCSEKPRQYDWQVHALGLPVLEGDGWATSADLDGGKLYEALPSNMVAKAKGDLERYDLGDVRKWTVNHAPWRVRVVQTCGLDSMTNSVMGKAWYDRRVGVDVRMLPEPGTEVFVGRTAQYIHRAGKEPGKGTRGDTPNEIGGTTLIVRRQCATNVFAALHEPFETERPRVQGFERIEQTPAGLAVRVQGDGYEDRILFQYGPDLVTPLVLSGGGESFAFSDRAAIRILPDRVEASGGIQSLRLRVTGSPSLVLNGSPVQSKVVDGHLLYGMLSD